MKGPLKTIIGLIAIAIVTYIGYGMFQKTRKPTEADGKRYLINYMSQRLTAERLERDGPLTGKKEIYPDITLFEKTNGQAGEKDGIKFYKMEYHATGKCGRFAVYAVIDGKETPLLLPCINNSFESGGTLYFEKTEKNWRGNARQSTIQFKDAVDVSRRRLW